MRDVIFVLVLVGFFAAAAGLVGLCERIIGRDDPEPVSVVVPPPAEQSDADGGSTTDTTTTPLAEATR